MRSRRVLQRWLAFASLCMSAVALADGLVDPTRPAGTPAATGRPTQVAAPPLTLQGIWNRGGERVAMVNGKRVRSGDDVQGARVLSVSEHEVVLRAAAGSPITLSLTRAVRLKAREFGEEGSGELAVRH